VLTLQGRYSEAEFLFLEMLARDNARATPRMLSRTQCYYAELLRLRGETENAVKLANQALERLADQSCVGDMADHALPLLAKLMPDARASGCLDIAMRTHQKHRNILGQARLTCLRARRFSATGLKDAFLDLRHQLPILQSCPIATRIAENWEEWSQPDPNIAPQNYWGL
jgi:hypothetical protein